MYLNYFYLVDKNDGASFSRSRSSSMSSLENVSKEAIQSLVFADSYTRKFGESVNKLYKQMWSFFLWFFLTKETF